MDRYICVLLLVLRKSAVSGDKIAELFAQIENDGAHREQSEIINNEYNSVLCWLETINSLEYRNGTRSVDRQFSIILETPGDLSNTSLDSGEVFNPVTKKSKPLHFATVHSTRYFTLRVNKTLVCGTGTVIIKEFVRWPSQKKRLQLSLGSRKMLETHRLKNAMRGEDNAQSKSNKPKKRGVNKTSAQSTNGGNGNVDKKQRITNEDLYGIKEAKGEIFKSTSGFEAADHPIIPALNQLNASSFSSCDVQHKINVRVQIYVEHRVTKLRNGEVMMRTPLTNVAKGQDFNIKSRAVTKFTASQEDVNKSWERLVKLLSRGYFIEYFHRISPFSELPLTRTNATINAREEFIIFDEKTCDELRIIQKRLQECKG